MTFGNLIFHILTLRKTGTAGELNIWENKGKVKEYCPDSKGLFKGIEPYFHDDRLHCPDDRLHRSGLSDSLYTKSDFVAMKTVVGRKNHAPHGNGLPKALFSIRKQLFEEHLADEVQVIFKMFFTIRGDQLLVIRLIIL